MDFSTMNIWCWIIPLLVGLLCAYFGYLLGKNKNTPMAEAAALKPLQEKNEKLQEDLDACRKKLMTGHTGPALGDGAAVTSMASEIPKEKPNLFDATAAKAAMGKAIRQDDLKIVEGIGPKISGMFNEAGIKTWQDLSEISVADCRKILASGGNRYKVHDPASWPMQAKMCYEGKWKELAKWQDKHDHGKL